MSYHWGTIQNINDMKKALLLKSMSSFLLGLLISFAGFAQNAPASPPAKANGKIGEANVTIDYSSPSVKGRKIFGEKEPYGKVWRAGANKATILEVDRDVTVEGKKLPAGKYSLFLTPNENEWTVILNSETGQWGVKQGGVANRDPAKDVLSVNVKPVKSASLTERLTYDITGDGIVMRWENVELPVAIK